MKVKPYIAFGFVLLITMVTLSCSSSTDKPQSAIHKSISAHEQVAEK